MSKMTDPKRVALADAIKARNEAAKVVEFAERDLAALVGELNGFLNGSEGEKLVELKRQHWQAQERVANLENEMRDARQRYGDDRVALNKHFMAAHDGKTGDELIAGAKANEEKTARERAAMEVAQDKLVAVLDDAMGALNSRRREVENAITSIMDDAIPALADDIQADLHALMQKVGALNFASRHVHWTRETWQHGHPFRAAYTLGGIFNNVFHGQLASDTDPYLTSRNQGTLPWQAARAQLEVDANADLPAIGRSS